MLLELILAPSNSNVLPLDIATVQRSIKAHLDGLFHLAHDGVLRSYDGDRHVIDYRQLGPELIAAYLRTSPNQELIQYDEWASVDGRQVTDEKALWDPPNGLQPIRFDENGINANVKSEEKGREVNGITE